jgi:hypothetical protein
MMARYEKGRGSGLGMAQTSRAYLLARAGPDLALVRLPLELGPQAVDLDQSSDPRELPSQPNL